MSVGTGREPALDGYVDAEALVELTQAVWASFVDPGLPLVDLGAWRPAPQEAGTEDDGVVGSVAIEGPSPGVVRVRLPASVAVEAAARMFDVDPADVAPADVHDATGEIANMVGGNVKAMLPGEHRLGLPSVTDGADCPGPVEALASAALLWGERTVLVTVDRAAGGSPS